MLRSTLLHIVLVFLWTYAFRNWMVSLCGLILLTSMMRKGDWLSQIGGVPGLNPWNLTLAVIAVAWFFRRPEDRKPWKLTGLGMGLLVGYIGIVVVSYVHAMLVMDEFAPQVQPELWQLLTVDYLINPLKYVLVALLLADGCHSRRRLVLALGTIVGLGVVYAILVVRIVPLDALYTSGGVHYRWRVGKEVGLMANDMAKVLAATFWSILATQLLWWRAWWSKIGVLAAYVATFLALAMCFSRGGYLTFVAVALMLGCVRWRKLLWLGPPVVFVLLVLMPTVTERLSEGLESDSGTATDWNEVTAGRTGALWPPVIEQIWKSPVIGHGRMGAFHTELYDKLEGVHPHNGYLEVLLDAGVIGFMVMLAMFVGAGTLSYRMARHGRDPLLVASGGVGLAHVTGVMVNALSGATFFPNQGMLGTLCALAIVLRVTSGRLRRAIPSTPGATAWWHPRPTLYQHPVSTGQAQP